MKRIAAAAALTFALAIGLAVTARAQLKVGATAPDFSVKSTAGKPVESKSLKGKVVLINFFDYT